MTTAGKRRPYGQMLRDLVWTSGSDGLILLAALVSFKILGSRLGPEDYGAYVGTFGIISPVGAITAGGLALAVMQRHLRDGTTIGDAVRPYLTIILAIAPLTIVATATVGSLVIDRLAVGTIALLAYSELVAMSTTTIVAAATQVTSGVGAASRIRMMPPLLRMACLLVLAWADAVTVRNAAAAWAVAFTLLALVLVIRQLPRIGTSFGFQRATREEIGTGLQLSLPTLANNLQSDADKAILNGYGLERDAGLYGAAYRVIKMALLPLRSLNGALFHRFLSHDETQAGQHLRRARSYSVVSLPMSLVLAAGLWVAAPSLLWLVGDEFEESVSIIRWLTLFLPLRSLSQAPLNGLLGLGQIKPRLVALLTASATSLVAYLVLIPHHSWKGAVMGTMGSEIVLIALGWGLLIVHQRRHDRSLVTTPDSAMEPAPTE